MRTLAVFAAVFVVARVPSVLEPSWYSDEGTYADVGYAIAHGASLYKGVWDNKPPGIYWLAALIVSVAGPSAAAFHVVLAVFYAAGAAGIFVLANRLGGRQTAVVAVLIFIGLTALPTLDGALFNAEPLGSVLCIGAALLMTANSDRTAPALGAGVLVGIACMFKSVFVFDVAAMALIPVWSARAAGQALRCAIPRVAALIGGAAVAVGSAVLAVGLTGSLGGLVDVLVHQDVSYVQRSTGAGGLIAHADRGDFVAGTLAAVIRVGLPLVIGAVACWRTSGKGRMVAAIVGWWLACDLAGAVVSARGFPHYAQQLLGSISIAAALLAVELWRHRPSHRVLAVAVVGALWPLLVLTSYAPGAGLALASGEPLPPLHNDTFPIRHLGTYYRVSIERLAGSAGTSAYTGLFPVDLNRMNAAIDLIRQNSNPSQPVFVWGAMHWVYARSGRVPAGRYVSLNSAYTADPHAEQRLVGDLTARPPAVIVVDEPLPPSVLALVQSWHYTLVTGRSGVSAWVGRPIARR
jgi:hypothetical protein